MAEIIPKPERKLPLWVNILFYFSIGLLLVTILAYFILGSSLKKSKLTFYNLEKILAQKKTKKEIALEKEILNWQKKIQHFTKLFLKPKYSLLIFEFIEKVTHPKIWFSEINLNPGQAKINILGKAKNFSTLEQQLQILKSNSSVKNVNLSQISIGKEGKVNFSLNLFLHPTELK